MFVRPNENAAGREETNHFQSAASRGRVGSADIDKVRTCVSNICNTPRGAKETSKLRKREKDTHFRAVSAGGVGVPTSKDESMYRLCTCSFIVPWIYPQRKGGFRPQPKHCYKVKRARDGEVIVHMAFSATQIALPL